MFSIFLLQQKSFQISHPCLSFVPCFLSSILQIAHFFVCVVKVVQSLLSLLYLPWLQVEEVKKHNHCLAFSSAGPQSQTYYVSFDSFTEHLRWHRHAAKVRSVWESWNRKNEQKYVFLLHYKSVRSVLYLFSWHALYVSCSLLWSGQQGHKIADKVVNKYFLTHSQRFLCFCWLNGVPEMKI